MVRSSDKIDAGGVDVTRRRKDSAKECRVCFFNGVTLAEKAIPLADDGRPHPVHLVVGLP